MKVLNKRGKAIAFFLDPSPKRFIHNAILVTQKVQVVSFPRSGRRWLRVMLHELAIDPSFTHIRIAASTADFETIRNGIEKYRKRRIIFLHRDPRDTVVSYYHHCRQLNRWNGSLKDFIRAPQWGIEKIISFNRSWLAEKRSFKDFLEVNYEDLRADTRPALRRIVDFSRCPFVSDEAIDACVRRNSFERMQQSEKSGELHGRFGKRYSDGARDDHMQVRRGIIGGYRDEMDDQDIDFCMGIMAANAD